MSGTSQTRSVQRSAAPGGAAGALAARAWRSASPRAKGGVALWLVGVLACYGARGYEPSASAKAAYAEKIGDLDSPAFVAEYEGATQAYAAARQELDEVKVWFWRLRTPYSTLVPPRQREHDAAWRELRGVQRREAQIVAAAKRELGVFSVDGVAESRNAFWRSYEGGKVFAQRQTFWDAVNSLLYSRSEENWVGFVLKWIVRWVINFTLGMIGAGVGFAWSLYSVVASFSPNLFVGLAFYSVTLFSALSMIIFILVALYGGAAGGAYVVLKTAADANRLEYQRRQARLRCGAAKS